MTFTYTGTLATNLDYIRFKIGDRAASAGPLPGTGTSTNFTDEEIAGLLAVEGTKERTVAALFEMLAGAWASKGNSEIGPRREEREKTSEHFAKLAKQWREDYGSAVSSVTSGFVTRVDGYSQATDSGMVDESSEV
jgi:hypothetical protein